MAPSPQHCWGCARSDSLLCAGDCVLTHLCRCLWAGCTPLCVQVDVHVCGGACVYLHMCTRGCDVGRCMCSCAFWGLHGSVCVCTPCHGCVHLEKSQGRQSLGILGSGLCLGGLSPTSCSSPAQEQPLLHEWGSVSSIPQHPLSPAACTPSDAAPAPMLPSWSTPGAWGMQGQLWGHFSRTAAPVTCVCPVASLGLCQLILSACLGVAFQGGADPAWCQTCPVPS